MWLYAMIGVMLMVTAYEGAQAQAEVRLLSKEVAADYVQRHQITENSGVIADHRLFMEVIGPIGWKLVGYAKHAKQEDLLSQIELGAFTTLYQLAAPDVEQSGARILWTVGLVPPEVKASEVAQQHMQMQLESGHIEDVEMLYDRVFEHPSPEIDADSRVMVFSYRNAANGERYYQYSMIRRKLNVMMAFSGVVKEEFSAEYKHLFPVSASQVRFINEGALVERVEARMRELDD